jgi:hypothetical protein
MTQSWAMVLTFLLATEQHRVAPFRSRNEGQRENRSE